ncbi:MAG: NUDIX hydrolase [Eubacterium sp.]|nr:NUDIX hydrolase [Eubacterium sp.]
MKKYIVSKEEKEFLKNYDDSKYEKPSLTADMAVFAILKGEETEEYRKDPEQKLGILLIKRGGFPYKGCWALPGGFSAKDEDLQQTAMRELMEETSVDNAYLEPFGVFSKPGRDPRGWIVSQAFLALVDENDTKISAGSDAGDAAWFKIDISRKELKKHVLKTKAEIKTKYMLRLEHSQTGEVVEADVEELRSYVNHHETVSYKINDSGMLAFDHAEIIVRAFMSLHEKAADAGRIIFDLMPEKFTLYSLQSAYEIVLGEKLTTPNFRRKIAPYVIETNETITGVGHRPAKLFKRNLDAFYE